MALPPAFLDELRARTPMAALVGRKVKLARSGKSWKGCCPFHGEKTPSFYVYDDGYHCFGCGAHGDAIGFVMQTEGAGFVEAVERLAGEAGLDVPKPTPQAAEAERERLDLTGVLDLAAASFTRRLHEREGREALAYLRGRGLTDETIARFGLGWSGEGGGPGGRIGQAGIEPARLAEAGLLQSRDDGAVRELFYNRVMFPIRDRRGRTISFGGRALGDAKPKYINGPETAVYSKSRTLYALDLAREGVRKSPHGAIVAEGLHGRDRAAPGRVRRRGGPVRHRADRRAVGRAVAAGRRARAVLRRGRRRRPGRRARSRTGVAADRPRPDIMPSDVARSVRIPTPWCAARARRLRRRAGR